MTVDLPPTAETARRAAAAGRRPGLRHAVVSAAGVLVLAAVVAIGLVAAPSGATPASNDAPELTADLPVLPLVRPAMTQPESGPVLDQRAWDRAIGTAVVTIGATKLGSPYVYSAGGPDAFDCSGFVRWAWMQMGVTLSHNSVAQWGEVDPIPLSDLQPGDIVFDSVGGPPSHVGLYVGDGIMIHAPNGGGVVRYDRVGWWTGATVTAGRVRLAS